MGVVPDNDLSGWSQTEVVYRPADGGVTHPSTNRARRRTTSLIETSALPLSEADPRQSSRQQRRRRWRFCTTLCRNWTWVDFARSNPTQSSNLMTQSNPIHDNSVYSGPHPIQSTIQTVGKITKKLDHGCTLVKHQ